MSDKRFHAIRLGFVKENTTTVTSVAVVPMTLAAYNALSEIDRIEVRLVEIKVGGMISEMLAKTWVEQIADQLNQFDVANAVVAKLT